MGAIASANSNYEHKDYETLEAGVYPARCIVCAELGTFDVMWQGEAKTRKELLLGFEVGELMQDGLPFVVSWRGTNSLNENSKLFKLLSTWRGKPFSQAELAHFEMKNVLDKCCLINVTTSEKDGKTWAKVDNIMPLPKGMNCAERVNDLVDFGIHEIKEGDWEKLWPWVQKAVLKSREGINYQHLNGTIAVGARREAPQSNPVVDESDLPF